MSHMVIYRGADGKPGYHQTDDIHDAVGFVEKMRNEDGVEHARIFRLEEIVFEYRPYYRVELAGALPSAAAIAELNGASMIDVDNPRAAAQSLSSVHAGPAGPAGGEAPDRSADVIEVIDGLDEPEVATGDSAKSDSGKSLFGR